MADTLDFIQAATAGGTPVRTFSLPFYNLEATADPTASNDGSQGYAKGSVWVNKTAKSVWICTDNTTGAAQWLSLTSGYIPVLFTIDSDITPAPSSAVSPFSPTGLSAATVIRIAATTTPLSYTGIDATGVADGRILIIVNVASGTAIGFSHESGLSAAANRIRLPGGLPIQLQYMESIVLRYSTVTSRWECVGLNLAYNELTLSNYFADITAANVSTTMHGLAPKLPGNTTTFLRGDGTYATPVTGKVPTSQTILTSGTGGTYTTPNSGVAVLRVRMWGPGGGGGGGQGGTSQASGASGGGAGGYLEKWIFSPSATYTYTIPNNGGAGGFNTSDGSAGGSATFSDGTLNLQCNGGSGGKTMATGTGVLYVAGGAGGQALNGDINVTGQPGESGCRLSGSVMRSGQGGPTLVGTPGSAGITNAAGAGGNGYGAGGTGASSTASNWSGAAGLGALAVIDEYY